MCTKRMIDTPTPVYNKFTIYNNSCVNFLKNGTNRKNARTHTPTHTFSLWYDILTHIIYIYIWYAYYIAFSKFTLLQAGCYFFSARTLQLLLRHTETF